MYYYIRSWSTEHAPGEWAGDRLEELTKIHNEVHPNNQAVLLGNVTGPMMEVHWMVKFESLSDYENWKEHLWDHEKFKPWLAGFEKAIKETGAEGYTNFRNALYST